MKSLALLFTLMLSGLVLRAQCISGSDTICLSQNSVYTVSSALGQCSQCYYWTVVSGGVSIVGSNTTNSVTLNANAAGPYRLQVTYFNATGCHVCTFDGIVKTCCPSLNVLINWANVEGDNEIKFLLTTLANLDGYSFEWTFIHNDQTTSWSYDKEPYITVPCTNPIKTASVKIYSGACTTVVTKTYPGVGICGTSTDGFKIATETAAVITVAPNPTVSTVYFTGKKLELYNIAVYNQAGYEVIKKTPVNKPLNLANYKKDIYLYVITGPDGFIQKGKILKQ